MQLLWQIPHIAYDDYNSKDNTSHDMEHLPQPIDSDNQPKVHLYVDKKQYAPDDFFMIPKKYGCEDREHLLQEGIPPGMPIDRANTLLQDWLWFGLLSKLLGIKIHSGNFVGCDNQTLDTGGLSVLIRAWLDGRQNEAALEPTDQQINRYIHASIALETARKFICKHLSYTSMENSCGSHSQYDELSSPVHSRIDRKLVLSIAILGETLQQARPPMPGGLDDRISLWKHPSTIDRHWGNSTYCRDLMRTRKWCPFAIHRIESTLPTVSRVYYESTIHQEWESSDHDAAGCTPSECRARQPRRDPVHYCHNNRCATVEVGEQQIVDIIKSGKTPLITWNRTSNPGIAVHAHDLNRWPGKFGALSHSWEEDIVASGLDERPGNNRQMHVCQLERLQRSFNSLINNDTNSENENVPFYVDVLGFPRSSEVKSHAIDQMKTIYSKANAVIVWDRNLIGRKKVEDTIEMNVRLRNGQWAQRLWTAQEAVLAKGLYVEFSGPTFLSLHEIEQAREKARSELSNRYHHIWQSGDPFSAAISALRLSKREDGQVQRTWEALQFRQSRHPEEEALVIANILRLSTQEIASIRDDSENPQVIAQRRMAKLLETMERTQGVGLPSRLIFLLKSRHNTSALNVKPGFGWAPETWMSRQSLRYPLFSPHRQAAFLRCRGLQVKFPGMILRRPNRIYTTSTIHVPVKEPLHKWWRIRIEYHGSDITKFWRDEIWPAREPSIILSVENPAQREEIGLLVVTNDMLDDDVRVVRVICRVWVRLETYSVKLALSVNQFLDSEDCVSFGERLPSTQKWCVDGGD
ncbi:hypothetical protein H2200_008409 [Cladophialophora chaetospira]|uniref:Heterokaryon incompatibility domain-containing protein n=1 Tax=Cladophialophora chaetospira TaxID=386627 RepID=A0AA38X5V5_9EURO|nr:hypothetical protein H2200_008409 [Cladophialophora chaetospira]